jgi:hypothetical protein
MGHGRPLCPGIILDLSSINPNLHQTQEDALSLISILRFVCFDTLFALDVAQKRILITTHTVYEASEN